MSGKRNKQSASADDDSKLDAELSRLAGIISANVDDSGDPLVEIPGMIMRRIDTATEMNGYIYEPSICITAGGAKRVILGDEEFIYDKHHFLVASVGLPIMAQVIDTPYLGVAMRLDMRIAARLMAEKDLPPAPSKNTERAMGTSRMSFSLLNAITRLAALVEEPESIAVLAPVIHKEIIFRLLVSDQGERLRQSAGVQSHQISRAVEWIRTHFSEPLKIDDLAESVSMSNSSFHHHFRSLTAMTPLQYQKKLRLYEARRLMLSDNFDASRAAFEVGYESPSQFSREYSRLFGNSPMRDIKSINQK